MFFKKRKKENQDPVFVVSIKQPFSGMYAAILEQNNIKFICRQSGTGGYLKIVMGDLLIPDEYYVKKENYDEALELYRVFIEPELEDI